MCDTPEGKNSGSPENFRNIRRNLDNELINARDSIKAQTLCVYARLRPLSPEEEAKGYKVSLLGENLSY